jgi:hypothetical protein
LATDEFPPGFLFGSSTAAHQVEGGNANNDWRDGSTPRDRPQQVRCRSDAADGGASPERRGVSTSIVINEVDYDQPSTATVEFLELKNVSGSPINLRAKGACGNTATASATRNRDRAGKHVGGRRQSAVRWRITVRPTSRETTIAT